MNNDKDELKELYELRELIDQRIDRLEQRIKMPAFHNGTFVVIESKDIRPYVQGWIDDGKPLTALAEKADVNVETIYRIMRGEQPTIRELTADKILQALELPHIYQRLVPEPPETKYYEE